MLEKYRSWLRQKVAKPAGESDFEAQLAVQRSGEEDRARELRRLDRIKASAQAEQGPASSAWEPEGAPQAALLAASASVDRSDPDFAEPQRADSRPDDAIEQARGRPIVFRQLYPPPAGGLSFYGGRPVGPAGLAWPRAETKGGERPLHFIMQWDCAELASQDPTGLLPSDGTLYLFCDLEWGSPLAFRFLHAEGTGGDWQELAVPDDLGPVYGTQGAWLVRHCTPAVPVEQQQVPTLLPKWPFKPVAFDYPGSEIDPDDEDALYERSFWNESDRVKEALLAAQNSLGAPLAAFSIDKSPPFARPFAAFPHDWAAVRVVCAEAIDRLQTPGYLGRGFMPDASEEEWSAVASLWLKEAQELYVFAANQPIAEAVPAAESEDIWNWLTKIEPAIRLGFKRVVEESVNASLGLGSEALSAVPESLIGQCWLRHALAHEFVRDEYPPHGRPDEMEAFKERQERGDLAQVRDIHAPSPDRMFGPPSYVHGDIEERMGEWMLLVELSSHEAIGHHFGEGVFQFVIRPDDLRDRRFDRAEVILSAY